MRLDGEGRIQAFGQLWRAVGSHAVGRAFTRSDGERDDLGAVRLARLAERLFATATGTAGEFRMVNPALVMVAEMIGVVQLPTVADGTLAAVARVGRDRVGSSAGVSLLPDGGQRTPPDDDAILVQPTHRCRPVASLLNRTASTHPTIKELRSIRKSKKFSFAIKKAMNNIIPDKSTKCLVNYDLKGG